MEMMLVVLASTAIGTFVGVTIALLMMNRKNRVSPTDAHLASLRNEGTGVPGVGNSLGVNLEDLRKLVADRDDALRQSHDDLQRASAECEQAKAQLEQTRSEGQHSQAQWDELRTAWEQARDQREHMQAECDQAKADAERARVLCDEAKAESEHAKMVCEQTKVETQQEALKRTGAEERIRELTTQLEEITRQVAEQEAHAKELAGQLAAASHSSAEEGSYRSSLEAQLTADREEIRHLTAHIDDLTRELDASETRLQEQKQLAAKGMEFLSLAQNHFSGVKLQNGNGTEAHVNGVEAQVNGAEAQVESSVAAAD